MPIFEVFKDGIQTRIMIDADNKIQAIDALTQGHTRLIHTQMKTRSRVIYLEEASGNEYHIYELEQTPDLDDKHCKSCNWWCQKMGLAQFNKGTCKSPKLVASTFDHDIDPKSLEYDANSCLYTGPEFGCIHWKKCEEES